MFSFMPIDIPDIFSWYISVESTDRFTKIFPYNDNELPKKSMPELSKIILFHANKDYLNMYDSANFPIASYFSLNHHCQFQNV